MFQKVGDWLTDKSDRFIRGEAGAPGSYYASSEAEQAYGRMQADASQEALGTREADSETTRTQPLDPFERAGKDYGGRVPYRSQRDIMAEQQRQSVEAYPQQGMEQAPQGYGQPAYGMPQKGYDQAQPAYLQTQRGYPPQAQGSPAQQPQANNVVPFPGMQRTPEGGVCTHIEYVVLLRSRNECKDVIEYIKANASVFLSMEFIASDSERQRCVDMLSGAAYTLGCALNRISPRGIYLISSPAVYVVIDPAIEKFGAAPEGYVRQSYEGGRFGSPRQNAGYQAGAYSPGQYPQASQDHRFHEGREGVPSRFGAAATQASPYMMQNTQRKPPATFGSVMAGNVTGMYQPANAYRAEDAPTGRQAIYKQ